MKDKRQYLFYLVKLIRQTQGFMSFDYMKLMKIAGQIQRKYVDNLPAHLKENKYHDSNHSEFIIMLKFSLKMIDIIQRTFNLGYFVGIFWLIMMRFNIEFIYGGDNPMYET